MTEQNPSLELRLGRGEPPVTFHPDLTEFAAAYRRYAESLSVGENSVTIDFSFGPLTETELATHVETTDKIGRKWVETMLEGTFGRLSPEQQAEARLNPELILQTSVNRFREAAESRRPEQP